MITPLQKQTAQAIVNVFETSTVLGDYGNVTLIPGDTGHLTFGRSQTTLGSGNLADLMQRYCADTKARFAARLKPFLPKFVARDVRLDNEKHLHNILRATADDPVMRDTQDMFFDAVYWMAAESAAAKIGVKSPLGIAVVYDSTVHGSWTRMRDRTTAAVGDVATIGEKAWIAAYISTRRDWLATNARKDLRPTVYRMEALQRLIQLGQQNLELPLVVRGQEISTATLSATPTGCYDGPQPGSRSLAVQTPLTRGLDVRLVQLGLSALGADIKADGVFGQGSRAQVKAFQASKGVPDTGVADPALIETLVA